MPLTPAQMADKIVKAFKDTVPEDHVFAASLKHVNLLIEDTFTWGGDYKKDFFFNHSHYMSYWQAVSEAIVTAKNNADTMVKMLTTG